MLGGGQLAVGSKPVCELGHPVAQDALRDGERDGLLAVEVQVDGTGRHAGLGDDVGHRRAVEALLGEATQRRVDDLGRAAPPGAVR